MRELASSGSSSSTTRVTSNRARLRADELLSEPLQFSIVLGVRGGPAPTPENLLAMVRRLLEDAAWQVIWIGRAV